MSINCVHIVGAGGHGKVVLDALILSREKWKIVVRDDSEIMHGKSILGYAIVFPSTPQEIVGQRFHVAIGETRARREIFERCIALKALPLTIKHPSAYVSSFSDIGAGSYVGAKGVVDPDVLIGKGVIINDGAIIAHDCSIGDFCHIAPNVTLGGSVTIGNAVLIGSAATVLPGITVGSGAIIGSGAVVTKHVGPGEIWVGVPARRKSEETI
jgi:sugar O-acyltransferase (sialic acid O-acetyltransferase NeuD family)